VISSDEMRQRRREKSNVKSEKKTPHFSPLGHA
jgi:hypothetical protein